MIKPKSVLIGLSGGVDSSVAAFLLKEEGFQVEGLYLHLVDGQKYSTLTECAGIDCQLDNRQRAYNAAQRLKIPFHEIDCRKDFFKTIIKDFIRQYEAGLTPNPCIFCNEKIKFRLLHNYAIERGFDYIATGHYARIEKEGAEKDYLLKRGIDEKKDQSYFLYRIDESILSKCIFPLGIFKKEDVKKIARGNRLSESSRKESQEICFILPGDDYRKLLSNNGNIKSKAGYFLDSSGNVLGRHKGISFYTIGQRKKLGLSLNSRKYVIEIRPQDNSVIIGDEKELYQHECIVTELKYPFKNPISESTRLLVQVRYNSLPALATLHPCHNEKMRILFDKAQRAIAPGQSAVFYDRDVVIGGGIIE